MKKPLNILKNFWGILLVIGIIVLLTSVFVGVECKPDSYFKLVIIGNMIKTSLALFVVSMVALIIKYWKN